MGGIRRVMLSFLYLLDGDFFVGVFRSHLFGSLFHHRALDGRLLFKAERVSKSFTRLFGEL